MNTLTNNNNTEIESKSDTKFFHCLLTEQPTYVESKRISNGVLSHDLGVQSINTFINAMCGK